MNNSNNLILFILQMVAYDRNKLNKLNEEILMPYIN